VLPHTRSKQAANTGHQYNGSTKRLLTSPKQPYESGPRPKTREPTAKISANVLQAFAVGTRRITESETDVCSKNAWGSAAHCFSGTTLPFSKNVYLIIRNAWQQWSKRHRSRVTHRENLEGGFTHKAAQGKGSKGEERQSIHTAHAGVMARALLTLQPAYENALANCKRTTSQEIQLQLRVARSSSLHTVWPRDLHAANYGNTFCMPSPRRSILDVVDT